MFKIRKSLLCTSIAGILSAGQIGLVAAADISVCPSSCDYTTINDGLAAATSGDRVVVGTPGRAAPEVYNENITMPAGVDLVSEGDDSEQKYSNPHSSIGSNTFDMPKRAMLTVIRGNGTDPVVFFPVAINSSLDGFTVEYVSEDAPDMTGLVMIGESSPTIINNIIRENRGPGINGGIMMRGDIAVVGAATTPLVEGNIIHYVNGPGVAINSDAYPTIRNNKIFTMPPGLSFTERTAPGIGMRDKASAIIEDNEIFRNQQAGIGSGSGSSSSDGHGIYDSGNDLIIRNNHIHTHGLAGIMIAGQRDQPTLNVNALIEGNDIHNNMAGIRTAHENLNGRIGTITVRGNTIDTHAAGMTVSGISKLVVDDNDIANSNMAGMRIQYVDDIEITNNYLTNEVGESNRAGIALFGNEFFPKFDFTITDNKIENSGRAGIRVSAHPDSVGIIERNIIDGSAYGGIAIMTALNLDIIDNEIKNSIRGGIHTGYNEWTLDESKLIGLYPDGKLHMNVRGNKVHNNGRDDLGGGIDVRHASGVVENNLVYRNHMGGIRVGDWIDGVNHNTVVENGMGGIAYDDIEGAVNDPPHGSPAIPFPIRNNVLVGNGMAGVNAGTVSFDWDDAGQQWVGSTTGTCGNWVNDRQYNLFTLNNGLDDSCNGDSVMPWCYFMQTATCTLNEGEILQDPLFVDKAGSDFSLQSGSPAQGSGAGGVDMGAYGGSTPLNW
ncbi:right-handed parallel beta-helix repeat-containing protein [Pseudomonadota bacterium]